MTELKPCPNCNSRRLKKYISFQGDCRGGGILNVGIAIGVEKQSCF